MPFDKTKYDIEYAKTKLKRIPVDVQKRYYDNVLKPLVSSLGMPMNTFIKEAIAEKLIRDGLVESTKDIEEYL